MDQQLISMYKKRLRENGELVEGDLVRINGTEGILERVLDISMGSCQSGFTQYEIRDLSGKLHKTYSVCKLT